MTDASLIRSDVVEEQSGNGAKLHREPKKIKRYNLALPEVVYNQLKEVAEDDQKTLVAVLQDFVKIGLTIHKIRKEDPDAVLMMRRGGVETHFLI